MQLRLPNTDYARRLRTVASDPRQLDLHLGRQGLHARAFQAHVSADRSGIDTLMKNLAIEWGMRPDNPANGFHRRIENPRERFLNKDEIDRLAAALDADPDQRAAGIIRINRRTARWIRWMLVDSSGSMNPPDRPIAMQLRCHCLRRAPVTKRR